MLNRRANRTYKVVTAWVKDAKMVFAAHRSRGEGRALVASIADPSLWAITLIRLGSALRAATGSSFGLSIPVRVLFHIDVWSDDIGPGLRLPHPFNIVIGEGATIGANCTLMHNVTVQRGVGTRIEDGAVLGAGAVVLGGANVGGRAFIGANSVVRRDIPEGMVAVGAPARVVRPLSETEKAQ